MFTKEDLNQLKEKNISQEIIMQQLEHFRNGFPFINLSAAATSGKGIEVVDEKKAAHLESLFESKAPQYTITKMVPASGAASRMFKDLHAFFDSDTENPEGAVREFINNIQEFAFFSDLEKVLGIDGLDIHDLLNKGEHKTIIRYLLTNSGLNYSSLPKGLLMFHSYPDGARTPLEEHMVEGQHYSKDANGKVNLHFTVSPEHMPSFIEKATASLDRYRDGDQTEFNISYSVQKPSTDTIAVDMNNEAFRNAEGSMLFRPGGHGALIENLNELDADIAFIKNIDNVVPDSLKGITYKYKKVIGGMLIELMEKSFLILNNIENGNLDKMATEEAIDFAKGELNIDFPHGMDFFTLEDKRSILLDQLKRPIRICGMVKNEGEPGGGPFWVTGHNGSSSLQVVESSQIDLNNPEQRSIVDQATHFNPVDLVCSLKDYKGDKFDLKEFVDPKTGFISIKSKDGRDLKALELPGLWNGAMARWITIFVEVPIETFNPVKTVNDLLRPQHQ